MIDARCSCGTVRLSLPGPSNLVAACHCVDCQRRTGAPFGVGAFYPVEVARSRARRRNTSGQPHAGGKVRFHFCTDCGPTVYWKADNLPALIGVAVGTIADPNFPAPIKSVFEQSKQVWVEIDGAEHLQGGSARKSSS
ncbi:hypothetical protein ABIB06_007511 [Bradyrhizobium sp. LB8.2]|uniref:GFA family protein n=1 Tax=unclassified Bradyrhizobium TaxID=2631580 RepID=UPI003394DFB9